MQNTMVEGINGCWGKNKMKDEGKGEKNIKGEGKKDKTAYGDGEIDLPGYSRRWHRCWAGRSGTLIIKKIVIIKSTIIYSGTVKCLFY